MEFDYVGRNSKVLDWVPNSEFKLKQTFKTILISTQIVTANHPKTLICLVVSSMNLTSDEHLPQPNAQIPGFEQLIHTVSKPNFMKASSLPASK
jgi:hypothetical protein